MLTFALALLAGISAAFAVLVFFAALSDLLLNLPAVREGSTTLDSGFEQSA